MKLSAEDEAFARDELGFAGPLTVTERVRTLWHYSRFALATWWTERRDPARAFMPRGSLALLARKLGRVTEARHHWHRIIALFELVDAAKPGQEDAYYRFLLSLRRTLEGMVIEGRTRLHDPSTPDVSQEYFDWIEGIVADTRDLLRLGSLRRVVPTLAAYLPALLDVTPGLVGVIHQLRAPLYRSRVFPSGSRPTQPCELGPPPDDLEPGLPRFGRANMCSARVFYASYSGRTALLETRPKRNGDSVVVGTWRPAADIGLAIVRIGPDVDYLAPAVVAHAEANRHAKKRNLELEAHRQIRQLYAEAFRLPVSEGDDPISYFASAVVAISVDVEGVQYPSVHTGGLNIALKLTALHKFQLIEAKEYLVEADASSAGGIRSILSGTAVVDTSNDTLVWTDVPPSSRVAFPSDSEVVEEVVFDCKTSSGLSRATTSARMVVSPVYFPPLGELRSAMRRAGVSESR